MSISARALSIKQLFELGEFEPARVQREYQWQKDQWRDLLFDLDRAFVNSGADGEPLKIDTLDDAPPAEAPKVKKGLFAKKPPPPPAPPPEKGFAYFLGPIVLSPRARLKDAYHIYDGQQRLTTITILLSALRTAQKKGAKQADIQKLLITSDKTHRLKIETPGGMLSRIIETGETIANHQSFANRSPMDQRINRAFSFFCDELSGWSDERRKNFLIFLRQNVFVTATFIEDRDLAETTYQTVNTRGLSLKVSDILKGHIIQLIGTELDNMQANEIAKEWDRTRKFVGNGFDHFVRAMDFITYRTDRSGEFVFRQMMDEFVGAEGAARAVKWVTEDLVTYRAHYQTISVHERQPSAKGINIPLRQMSFLDWRDWQPVAMALCKRHNEDPKALLAALTALQRVCYVMHLIGWSDRPRSRTSSFAGALAQIEEGLDPFARSLPGGARGALFFSAKKMGQARGALVAGMQEDGFHGPIVRWLETLYWPDDLPRAATDDATVEHILPRNHGNGWQKDFPDEGTHETYKNKLGNFCILPRDEDAALRDVGFKEKRAVYKRQRDFFKSAREVAAYTEWTPATIDERTALLAKRAAEALGIATASKSVSEAA